MSLPPDAELKVGLFRHRDVLRLALYRGDIYREHDVIMYGDFKREDAVKDPLGTFKKLAELRDVWLKLFNNTDFFDFVDEDAKQRWGT